MSWTAYMHLGSFAEGLTDGDAVKAGQQIGLSGDTGNAKGEPSQLHFEIRTKRRGGKIDPTEHLQFQEQR